MATNPAGRAVVVNMSDFEDKKENFQPLKSGRVMSKHAPLAPTTAAATTTTTNTTNTNTSNATTTAITALKPSSSIASQET
jgi:hypothetical protein